MSSIVKVKNPKTGITYVYESESYWDKELKQPRNHRKLIGKLNEKGEVVPTGKKGRPRTVPEGKTLDAKTAKRIQEEADTYVERCRKLEIENDRLMKEVSRLQGQREEMKEALAKLIKGLDD